MDETSTEHVGQLRRRARELEGESHRLEAQVAHLEKALGDGPEDGPSGKRLGELQLKLDRVRAELERARDELEETERARAEAAEATDELESLVDDFADVAAGAPELADVLAAMRLCVGALATARRLARATPEREEPPVIAGALGQALHLLARTLSTARGRALTQGTSS